MCRSKLSDKGESVCVAVERKGNVRKALTYDCNCFGKWDNVSEGQDNGTQRRWDEVVCFASVIANISFAQLSCRLRGCLLWPLKRTRIKHFGRNTGAQKKVEYSETQFLNINALY